MFGTRSLFLRASPGGKLYFPLIDMLPERNALGLTYFGGQMSLVTVLWPGLESAR